MDHWWRKKSLVDTIFQLGHWSKEVSNAYVGDLKEPAPDYQPPAAATGDAAVSRDAAAIARKRFRNALNQRNRAQASYQPSGQCGCGWLTDWEPEVDMQPRVRCLLCSSLVCRRHCTLPGYAVCMRCCPTPPEGRRLSATVPRTEQGQECACCRLAGVGTGAGGGGVLLRRCVQCNRWLCRHCRHRQAPTLCVVCPALHATDLPSLRQCWPGPSHDELDRLRQIANKATAARGRGRLCTGQYMHQSDIDGRAARVGMHLGKRPRLAEEEALG